jgi:hypothetical protein
MRCLFLFFAAAVAFGSSPARAAQVEGLRVPAWLERAGEKQPLRAAMTLSEADTVETGASGRLYIRLADGSFIKLGENARLALNTLQEDMAGGVIKGLLNVVRGAFRYTAGAIHPILHRELIVQVASATIGIRGTDIWARSQEGGATVCLIEGQISVHIPVRGDFDMDQPLSSFVAPAEGEPQPVGPVNPELLQQWTAETDLDRGKGTLLPGGAWIVQLGSHRDEATAREQERRLLASGIPVERSAVQLQAQTFYRVRVSGFDTEQDAREFATRIQGQPGVAKPWVSCEVEGRSCE